MSAKQILAQAPDLLTESQFSGLVVEVARLGGWTRRYHSFYSRRSPFGFPDWVFVKDGRLLFAELKSESGKLSDEQRAWIDALQMVALAAPGVVEVHVWQPHDWDSIVETLTGRKPREEAA